MASRVQVSELCASVVFLDDVKSCHAMFATAHYADVGAVNLCQSLTFWSNRRECAKAIVNKVFQPEALASCAQLHPETAVSACLWGMGSSVSYP